MALPSAEICMPPTRARRLVQSVGPSSGGTFMAAAPRPPALRDSSVIGCFWAKAEAARRRRMPNFVMVAIVAIRWRRFTAEFNATEELRGGRGWATRKNAPKNGGRPEGTRPERLRYGAATEQTVLLCGFEE